MGMRCTKANTTDYQISWTFHSSCLCVCGGVCVSMLNLKLNCAGHWPNYNKLSNMKVSFDKNLIEPTLLGFPSLQMLFFVRHNMSHKES